MKTTWPFVILVKYASRGRKQRFLDGLQNIYSTCAQPEYIRVLVTADIDDSEMFNDEVRDKVNSYPNAVIIYGTSKSKIHACNRDLDILPEEFKDYSILANFSDDMRWSIFGWDDMIRVDFNNQSPDFSHYFAYHDPDTKGALSTLFIAGRRWVEMFGFIYDPQFQSLFCDNLVEDVAKHLGKYIYTGNEIYRHYNPSYGYERFEADQLYLDQQRIGWSIDQNTYDKIKKEGIVNYINQFVI